MKRKILRIILALALSLPTSGLFSFALGSSNMSYNNIYQTLRPWSNNRTAQQGYGATLPFFQDYVNDNNNTTYVKRTASTNNATFNMSPIAYEAATFNSVNLSIKYYLPGSFSMGFASNGTAVFNSTGITFGGTHYNTQVFNLFTLSNRDSSNFTLDYLRSLSFWESLGGPDDIIYDMWLDVSYNITDTRPTVSLAMPNQTGPSQVTFRLTTSGPTGIAVNWAGVMLFDDNLSTTVQNYIGPATFGCNQTFTFVFNDLQPNHNYRASGWAANVLGAGYSNEKQFQISDLISGNITIGTNITIALPPSVLTYQADNVSATKARFSGRVITTDTPLINQGVEWWPTANFTAAQNRAWPTSGRAGTTLTWTEMSLSPNTSYTYRYFASNGYNTGYGNNFTFTTKTGIPDVVLYTELPGKDPTSRIIQVGIPDMHGDRVTTLGVNLTSPSDNQSWYVPFASNGTFNITVKNLLTNTTYNVTAFATGEAGTGVSNSRSFTTAAATVPTMKTGTANKTGAWTFFFNGEIVATNGAVITERGFAYTWVKGNYTAGFKDGVTELSGSKMVHGNFGAGTYNMTIGSVDIPNGYTTLWYHSVVNSDQGPSVGGEMYFSLSDNSSGGDTENNTGNQTVVVTPTPVQPGKGPTPKTYIENLIGDDPGTWWLVLLGCMVGAFCVCYASPTMRVIAPIVVLCFFIAMEPAIFGWLVVLAAIVGGVKAFKTFNAEETV